ncbi:MAG: serine/threonine-protein kinase, partial [Planctomycetota bacterium]
ELGEEGTRTVLVQLLQALAFLHNQGWVHGDIKPENLLLRRPLKQAPLEVCLIDFGLAHRENRPPEERILGTVYYMPPERIMGARLDRRGDLYSFGILTYQLFTGRVPFAGPGKMEVLQGHLRRAPQAPREICSELAKPIEELILALLEKKPSDRPASAEEVLQVFHKHWQEPAVPETSSSLMAYIRLDDCTGWEDPAQETLGKVQQRSGGGKLRSSAGFAAEESGPHQETHLLPLWPHMGGSTGTGMLMVKGPTAADLALFRDHVLRQVEPLGVPHIYVRGSGPVSPFAQLILGALKLLPGKILQDEEVCQELSLVVQAYARGNTNGILHAVADFLSHMARHFPFFVIVEGLEECDHHFFQFLALISTRERTDSGLRRIAWIAFQRRAPGLFQAQWMSSNDIRTWLHQITLPTLDPESIIRWFDARFPGWHPPLELRYLLEEESEGSPALMAKLLCALVDEGYLRKSWRGWAVAPLGTHQYQSPLVRRSIRSYEQSDASSRAVLDALVVLGGNGDPDWLRQASGLDAVEVLETMVQLQRRGWIDREVDGSRYRFRYFFQNKAVRKSISDENWREYNQRIAEWILEKEREGRSIEPERIAKHLLEASQTALAIPYARQAARQALREGHILSGIGWIERLLSSGEDLSASDRLVLIDELGDLRQVWGPQDETLKLRKETLRIAIAVRVDRSQAAILGRKLAWCEAQAGDFDSAVERINAVLPFFQEPELQEEYRKALLFFAELNLARGEVESSLEVWEALDSLPPSQNPALQGWEILLRVDHYHTLGHALPAREHCWEGILQLEKVPCKAGAAWCAYLLGRLYEVRGRWQHAIRQYRLSAHQFQRLGRPLMQARGLLRIGELYLHTGQPLEGDGYLKRAASLFDRVGGALDRARLAWTRGLLLSRSGWIGEAQVQFSAAHQWGKLFPGAPWCWEALLAQAEVELRSGRLERCGKLLAGASHPTRAPHRTGPDPWLRWGMLIGDYYLKRGEPGRALQANLEVLQEIRERGELIQQIPLWMVRWRLLQELGCQEEGRRLATHLEEWVSQYPEFSATWEAYRGVLDERELQRRGDEEELARYYRNRGRMAMAENDWKSAIFLLEEAQFHARRVRAQPLTEVIGVALATVRSKVFSDERQHEELFQHAWRTLVGSKLELGRAEILWLWARYREEIGDLQNAEKLRRSAMRHVQRWSEKIPLPHDDSTLANFMGILKTSSDLSEAAIH